jgi:hypothetical protein
LARLLISYLKTCSVHAFFSSFLDSIMNMVWSVGLERRERRV